MRRQAKTLDVERLQVVSISDSHREVYGVDDQIAIVTKIMTIKVPHPIGLLSFPTRRRMNANVLDFTPARKYSAIALELKVLSDLGFSKKSIFETLALPRSEENVELVKYLLGG